MVTKMRKMLELQVFFFLNYWSDKWLLENKKNDTSGICPYANQEKFTTKTVCKNVIKKFVSITLFLEESMILLKGKKM